MPEWPTAVQALVDVHETLARLLLSVRDGTGAYWADQIAAEAVAAVPIITSGIRHPSVARPIRRKRCCSARAG